MEDEEANLRVEDHDHPRVGLDDWLNEIRKLIQEHRVQVERGSDENWMHGNDSETML